MLQFKFQLKSSNNLGGESKIGFQDGICGGHFGLPDFNYFFYLNINLLLHPMFQLNSPCGLQDVQNRVSR